MKNSKLVVTCPLGLNDKVKIILDVEPFFTLSESIYTVADILTTHSASTGIVKFEIVLKDEFERLLSPRNPKSIQLLSKIN